MSQGLRQPTKWVRIDPVALGGDFEVSASFDIKKLGDPARPRGEANVELAVAGTDARRIVGVNVNANPGDGRCFHVIRYGPHREGVHWGTLSFPRFNERGRLALRRRGAELIILVADGAAAPLVELVRFPADPRLSPAPQLSAFQGHGPEYLPIDGTVSDIRVTAERISREPGAAAEPDPLPAPESYPVTLDYSQKASKLLFDFPRGGDGAFVPESGGLRASPPPLGPGDSQAYRHRDSRFVVAGDFEVSCQLGAPAAAPPGPQLREVGIGLFTDTPIGSVYVGTGIIGRDGPRLTVTRDFPTLGNPSTLDIQRVAWDGKACRVTLRRTGAELTITTQEGGEPSPVELVRFPFPPGLTPRVRVWTFQGGPPPAPVDALVSDFRVRAGGVSDPDAPDFVIMPEGEPVVLAGLPAGPASRKWRYLAAAACVGLAGVVAAGVAWRVRGR